MNFHLVVLLFEYMIPVALFQVSPVKRIENHIKITFKTSHSKSLLLHSGLPESQSNTQPAAHVVQRREKINGVPLVTAEPYARDKTRWR